MTSSYSSELADRDSAQLRDSAVEMAAVLRDIPTGVIVPTTAVRSLHEQLGDSLRAGAIALNNASVFPPKELAARVESLLAHEEIRLRFGLEPDAESLLPQLETAVGILVREAVPRRGWGELLVADRSLLACAHRLDGTLPREEIGCRSVGTYGASAASVLRSRTTIQRLAATVLVASKQVAIVKIGRAHV